MYLKTVINDTKNLTLSSEIVRAVESKDSALNN